MSRVDWYNEIITFVIRETGWTLEYVCSMYISHLFTLYEELKYQKAVEEYRRDYPVACVAVLLAQGATIADIIGPEPKRLNEMEVSDIWQVAKDAGIKIPSL